MEVGGHSEVLVQGGLRISPYAEEVDLAADFFAPLTVVVRGQGKRGARLSRLLSAPVC